MIRIAIVDDSAIVRAGLCQFFVAQEDFSVVQQGSSSREALDIVRQGGVDVLLLDTLLPDVGGVDTLLAVRARAPELGVLMLGRQGQAPGPITLLRMGASGSLDKHSSVEDIVCAVRTVARGRRFISPDTAEALARQVVEDPARGLARAPHEQLSLRELQVFLQLARGQTLSHVAQSLSLSVKTVSTYRSRVMEKMLLVSNSGLTYYAMKNGLIQ